MFRFVWLFLKYRSRQNPPMCLTWFVVVSFSHQEMLSEVSHVTDQFILRRTNRLNARFLPPKQILNVLLSERVW